MARLRESADCIKSALLSHPKECCNISENALVCSAAVGNSAVDASGSCCGVPEDRRGMVNGLSGPMLLEDSQMHSMDSCLPALAHPGLLPK